MRKIRLFVAAASVVGVIGLGASPAFAGEVKGPPGTTNNTNVTGALDHANSACAASGLNDLDTSEGQSDSQVQTAADSWKYYALPKGAPGKLGLCKGGTGEI
jgi:hypothetical protein